MLMVFWDSQVPLCEHYPEMQCRCWMTVSSAQCSETLQNELWPAVHTKQRLWLASFSFVTWQCLLSYCCHTLSTLQTLIAEVLEHSAVLTFCRWWCEGGGAWSSHETTKTIYSIASEKLVGGVQSVLRIRETVLRNHIFLMPERLKKWGNSCKLSERSLHF
jgi:hypothetical protein